MFNKLLYKIRRTKMTARSNFYILLAICVVISYVNSAKSCMSHSDCNEEDCCIEYFPFWKRCKDKGDDVGDRCGGQFNCGCKTGMHCIPDQSSLWNYVKFGNGYCSAEKGSSRYIEAEAEPILLGRH